MDIVVNGMTCDHCVHAVTTELLALPEISAVAVDLVPGGASTVHIDGFATRDEIRAAIDEAGYELID